MFENAKEKIKKAKVNGRSIKAEQLPNLLMQVVAPKCPGQVEIEISSKETTFLPRFLLIFKSCFSLSKKLFEGGFFM